MSVTLHHINIQAPLAVLQKVRAFYLELLDLVEGERPAFQSEGFWLYSGAHPLIHLKVVADAACPRTVAAHSTLDHVAFACTDLPAMQQRIAQMALPFETVTVPRLASDVPGTVQKQIFVHDPAGNCLELNFVVQQESF